MPEGQEEHGGIAIPVTVSPSGGHKRIHLTLGQVLVGRFLPPSSA
jgi:hypothetical protein